MFRKNRVLVAQHWIVRLATTTLSRSSTTGVELCSKKKLKKQHLMMHLLQVVCFRAVRVLCTVDDDACDLSCDVMQVH